VAGGAQLSHLRLCINPALGSACRVSDFVDLAGAREFAFLLNSQVMLITAVEGGGDFDLCAPITWSVLVFVIGSDLWLFR
jgi:hypothetical protein